MDGPGGQPGVVVYSQDAKVHWIFTDPESLIRLSKGLEQAALQLVAKRKGAGSSDMAVSRKYQVLADRLLSNN